MPDCKPRSPAPLHDIRAQQRALHIAVEGELALPPVEARHRTPAPERAEAALRRAFRQRKGGARQKLAPIHRARLEQPQALLVVRPPEPGREPLKARLSLAHLVRAVLTGVCTAEGLPGHL